MVENQLNQMISFVKEQKGVDGIILVLNYNSVEFLDNLESLIKKLYNEFPVFDFWEHVCIVWTKCFYYTTEKKLEKQMEIKNKQYQEQLTRIAKETTGKEGVAFPMFFVDSQPDEGEDNSRTDKEIETFLAWARSLLPIKPIEKVMKESTEFKTVVVEEKEDWEIIDVVDGCAKCKVEKKRREKRIGHNKKVSYTDWEIIDRKVEEKPLPKKYANNSKEELTEVLLRYGNKLFELVISGIMSISRVFHSTPKSK
ncbi:AIG1 family protein [Entamoeba histolytica HM-3:IMSS]|uniref:AIG1 family protein n=1 Tax=Entamoeba histolytica HM-3:IMSS TaxID=885315 RepID=M7WZP1_ENTHI|nr:AIG1 family protein [Entamoeba histolytica HM-3:IMSS]